MIKVSIIVPVYNAEKYLSQCMESVMNQTLEDIEIICIDDGSTDASGRMLDDLAMKDKRVLVVHRENKGLVSARKAGVALAHGKYIGYVDSDDWIESQMYEELYSLAEEHQVELVTSGYFLEGNYTTLHLDTVEEGVYKDDAYNHLLNQAIYNLKKKETGIRASLCPKLFLREALIPVQNKIPEDITMAEDKMCLIAFLLEAETIYICKKAFYHYRINNTSMVHMENTKYLLAVNSVYSFLIELYQHPKFTDEMRKQTEIYILELLFKGMNTLMGFQNQNMLWIDPYWLEKIPQNSKIVLYGAGALGKKYKKHLDSRNDLYFVGCVDEKECFDLDFHVHSIEALKELEYDYIVITIKNPAKASEIKNILKTMITEEKILWFEQPEVFWKYVQADGLLETDAQ